MNTKLITAGLALALIAIPASAAAGHANGQGQSHENFPGLPGAAAFGLCQAAENQPDNENSSMIVAPPFQWLFDTKDCENVEHPSDEQPDTPEQADQGQADQEAPEDAGDQADEYKPDDAGPPEDTGRPDHAGPP